MSGRAPPLAVILVLGCGPSVSMHGADAALEWPLTCGEVEAKTLLVAPLQGATAMVTARVGDRFIVDGWTLEHEAADGAQWAYSVDDCGQAQIELAAPRPGRSLSFGAAGPWMLAADLETSRITWLDGSGQAPEHVVFEEAHGCIMAVGDGLATQDSIGNLWFHPDPSDPTRNPDLLAGRALFDDEPAEHVGDFTRCTRGTKGPIIDDAGLITALPEGPLFRIDVDTRETQTFATGPIVELATLDDRRFVLWRVDPVDGCCDRRTFDRETGEVTQEYFNLLLEDLAPTGAWVTLTRAYTPDFAESRETILQNLATKATFEVDEWWKVKAAATPSTLFTSGDLGHALVDTRTRQLTLLDFPVIEPGSATHPMGVFGLVLTNPFPDYGSVLLLPREGGAARVIGEDIYKRFWFTRSGTIVTLEDVRIGQIDEVGTLVIVLVDGTRTTIDEDVLVSSITVPFYATDRELSEVLYVRGGEQSSAELRRLAIP